MVICSCHTVVSFTETLEMPNTINLRSEKLLSVLEQSDVVHMSLLMAEQIIISCTTNNSCDKKYKKKHS